MVSPQQVNVSHRYFALFVTNNYDSVTYSELIKCCLARGANQKARLVHKHIFSDGYQPKTFLINTLMNMYVKFNLLNEARQLFDQMPERNVVSPLICILILPFCELARATFRQIHCSITKTGLDSDVFVRSALIDNYSKWGELPNTLTVFNEMETSDLIVWNSVIGAFAQNTDGDEALNLFKRMKRCGFMADQATLTSVLRACAGLALLELGRQIHVHVLKYKNRDLTMSNASMSTSTSQATLHKSISNGGSYKNLLFVLFVATSISTHQNNNMYKTLQC
ncbi:LOW QUALITY PROTEIN: hypothetical protein OSB04_030543 [Centaurea solstitialis]|uniref:Pentatricopeptide repeat-containing protein n=1 Tax=Centaurea solstitialis TaxID=347529 RepID=A0AA38S7T7_9ASTR|nr:LOW QUALITY PROTEIN: hypothetical protein OSB04_030543 [Centaurea solstitialis]